MPPLVVICDGDVEDDGKEKRSDGGASSGPSSGLVDTSSRKFQDLEMDRDVLK